VGGAFGLGLLCGHSGHWQPLFRFTKATVARELLHDNRPAGCSGGATAHYLARIIVLLMRPQNVALLSFTDPGFVGGEYRGGQCDASLDEVGATGLDLR
jgi:hypothetical protein